MQDDVKSLSHSTCINYKIKMHTFSKIKMYRI